MPKTYIFTPEEHQLLIKRCERLVCLSKAVNSPYIAQAEAWLILSQASRSPWRALWFIAKDLWHSRVMNTRPVFKLREILFSIRTGRPGLEYWDDLLGQPPGTHRIEQEETKAVIQGRKTTDKIQ